MRLLLAPVGGWERESWALAAGGVVVLGTVLGLFALSWDALVAFWGVVLVLTVAGVITAALVRSTAALSDIGSMTLIMVVSLVAKAGGTLARYLVSSEVYDGSSDAFVYDASARVLGTNIHEGVFSLAGTPMAGFPNETQSIGWLLGLVYSVTGASEVVAFLIFGWLSWVGLVLFYRAYRVALPHLSSKGFALLVFFLPSLVYWPSSVGKEAVMVFLLGLATLGFSRLLVVRGPGRGVIEVAVAAAGILWIRPHLALLLLGAAAVALLVQHPGDRRARSRLARTCILVALVPALLFSMTRVSDAFGEANNDGSVVQVALQEANERTTTGGSAFTAEPVRSPLDVPVATVNVLLRPFPWQASGGPALIASLEGLFLVGLVVRYWRSLLRLPQTVWRSSPVAFAVTFLGLFIFAFSNIGNAGILARQRTQVMPFVLLAACATVAGARLRTEEAEDEGIPDESAPSPSVTQPGAAVPPVLTR